MDFYVPDIVTSFDTRTNELANFINSLTHQLKFLRIKFQLLNLTDLQRLQTILNADCLTNLHELKFEVYLKNESKPLLTEFELYKPLKDVKKLHIQLHYMTKNVDLEMYTLICDMMFHLTPNIETIGILARQDGNRDGFDDKLKQLQSARLSHMLFDRLKNH